MVQQGTDIIELGIPFSDPMAEGISIQKGHERALGKGVSLKGTFELLKKFRANDEKNTYCLYGLHEYI